MLFSEVSSSVEYVTCTIKFVVKVKGSFRNLSILGSFLVKNILTDIKLLFTVNLSVAIAIPKY